MTKAEKMRLSVAGDAAKEAGVFAVGEWVAVLCVNPIYFGRIVAWDEGHYHLGDASWVVETGRLSDFIKDPQATAIEAEYIGAVTVERSSVQAVYRHLPEGKVTTR